MDWNSEMREIWNRNAAWWDEKIGAEGNAYHRILVAPATERLLRLKAGETVLDIACGNGQFSRRMAELGARVVAVDFSEVFIERAHAHTTTHADQIHYQVLDVTDPAALRALEDSRFDAAVCTMALMDIADLGPLARALPRLLKLGGRFVFSVPHPCFNTTGATRLVEEEYIDGTLRAVYAIKVKAYITPEARQGIGIVGQPVPQYYFERPLHVLLGTFLSAGFVLDRTGRAGLDAGTCTPRHLVAERDGDPGGSGRTPAAAGLKRWEADDMPNIGWPELIMILSVVTGIAALIALVWGASRARLFYGVLALAVGYILYSMVGPQWQEAQSWLAQIAGALNPQIRAYIGNLQFWRSVSLAVMGAGGLAVLAGLLSDRQRR